MPLALISSHASELIAGTFAIIGTALGAFIVSIVNMKMKEQEINAQNRRASVDYLLQKEAETLIELLETGENAYVVCREYASQNQGGKANKELKQDANAALDDFERVVRKSRAFLSDEDMDDVKSLLESVRSLVMESDPNTVIDSSESPKITIWRESENKFDDFTNKLQNLLRDRIEEIRDLED